MGLRIVPDLFSTLLSAVSNNRQHLNTALQQISTGQSVSSPSDNPAATAALIENTSQSNNDDQFLTSISSVQGVLQTADSTLGSIVNNLNQAISLGTEGANGSISLSERQAMAQEIQSIQQTIQGLANTSYQGAYLFAGTNVTTQPYVTDSSSSSGVRYTGNSGVNSVQVGPGQSVSLNLPGSAIFNASGADVFQALHDLNGALTTGVNITSALGEVRSAFDNVNSQRTFYGNTLDKLNSINTEVTQELGVKSAMGTSPLQHASQYESTMTGEPLPLKNPYSVPIGVSGKRKRQKAGTRSGRTPAAGSPPEAYATNSERRITWED